MTAVETDIAVGTKLFSRANDVERLLSSVPEWVSTVYIADDGEPSAAKDSIYNQTYPFELTVIDLEYDAGVGVGRNAIVQRLSEEFVFIVDPDHMIPPNAMVICEQLIECSDVGGVSGLIFEPDRNRLYSQARDFCETNSKDGTILSSVVPSNKQINVVEGAPLAYFDWIPQATLYRKKCLEEQAWDPEFVIGFEHEDIYVSHWKQTDWRFAVSPSVCFPHYPGGDTEYQTNRHDPDKSSYSKEYFLNKWGYAGVESRGDPWIDINPQMSPQRNVARALDVFRNEGASALFTQLRQYAKNRGISALFRQSMSYSLRTLSEKIAVD